MAKRLSPHFKESEFTCPCCNKVVVNSELVNALESLRALVGKPIIILSGYRCQSRNSAVGGARNSLHMSGRAADVSISGMSGLDIVKKAKEISAFRGFGIGPNWAHLDIRKGSRKFWLYQGNRRVNVSGT